MEVVGFAFTALTGPACGELLHAMADSLPTLLVG